MKKKGIVYTVIGAAATTAVAGILIKGENRKKMKEKVLGIKNKFQDYNEDEEFFPIKKAGHPNPEDLEENKMISEGSIFGVNYYNEQKLQDA